MLWDRRSYPTGSEEAKRRPDTGFQKKWNERQFLLDDNVKDQIDAADKRLELVEPPNEAQREALHKAKMEIEKG